VDSLSTSPYHQSDILSTSGLMTADSLTPSTRRSDAERNRKKILSAARMALADTGADLSMAEVARRAGVGMATLYRNFPGRRELLEALFTEEVDRLCKTAADMSDAAPGAALTTWLRRFAAFLSNKHRLAAELLKHTDTGDPVFDGSRARVVAAGRPLLASAQAAHEVREDLTIEQVLDMVLAVVTIHHDAEYVEPILQTALDGLFPRAVERS